MLRLMLLIRAWSTR